MEIRPLTLTNLPAFRETLDAVARERRYLCMLEAPPLERLQDYISKSIGKGGIHLIAVEGPQIVGWCDISVGGAADAHLGYLGMGVLKACRGQGIGRRLLEAAIVQARIQHLEKIELQVFPTNAPALALYKKLGFVEEGLRKRARKVDDVYDDILLMALFLS